MLFDPFVSVILPCYNAKKTLYETLLSIKNQTFTNWELIFINDGSIDSSLNVFSEFISEYNIKYKLISRENLGFIYSLEEGIALASGDFIARIDSDDVWLPNHLADILYEFFLNKELGLVGSNCIFIDIKGFYVGSSDFPSNDSDIRKYLLRDNPFIHSSVVFKKSIYLQTGGYNLSNIQFGYHVADFSLWFEFSKFCQIRILSKKTLKYRLLYDSMSRSIPKISNYQQRLCVMNSVYKYYRKNFFYYFFFKILVHCKLGILKIQLK